MASMDSFPGPTGNADANEAGKGLGGLVVSASGVPRAGIFPNSVANLITGRADLKVDIGIFQSALVRGGAARFSGNDASATVPAAALTAPGSNTKYAVFYQKQNETAAGDATNTSVIDAVQGNAFSSLPTALADARALLPAGALELGHVALTAGATATNAMTITQTYPYTAAAGGIVLFRTIADMKLWTTAIPGQRASIIGAKGVWEWDGTIWCPMFNTRLEYTAVVNVPNAPIPSFAYPNTPTFVSTGSSAIASEFLTPVTGGWTVVKSGIYLMGGPIFLDISGTKQTIDTRSFVEQVVNGSVVYRNNFYSGPSEDVNTLIFPPLALTAGQTLTLNYFQSDGTTVTVNFRPTFVWLGPII
jgi:hypothetical protein